MPDDGGRQFGLAVVDLADVHDFSSGSSSTFE